MVSDAALVAGVPLQGAEADENPENVSPKKASDAALDAGCPLYAVEADGNPVNISPQKMSDAALVAGHPPCATEAEGNPGNVSPKKVSDAARETGDPSCAADTDGSDDTATARERCPRPAWTTTAPRPWAEESVGTTGETDSVVSDASVGHAKASFESEEDEEDDEDEDDEDEEDETDDDDEEREEDEVDEEEEEEGEAAEDLWLRRDQLKENVEFFAKMLALGDRRADARLFRVAMHEAEIELAEVKLRMSNRRRIT